MHDPFSEQSRAPRRPLRIASEIMRIMPDLIRRLVKLPEGIMVSIVGVEVTKDLSHATVFFSVIGNDEESRGQNAEKLLNAKRGAVRKEIAGRLVMRQHPEIRFQLDRTAANAARIEQLLNQIKNENRGSDSTDQ
jgi:ribosome-binding factor A